MAVDELYIQRMMKDEQKLQTYSKEFTQRATKELYKAYHLFNEKVFDGELPEPAILIQSQGNRTKYIDGWCTQEEIWMNEEKTIRKYEVNICAEYLNRPMEDILQTLLHQLVHLYCMSHNIQDTSRKGNYHNKKFKLHAEHFGLEVESDKKHGFAHTRLQHGTQHLIQTFGLDQSAFQLRRFTFGEEDGEAEDKDKKEKKLKNVWECPDCHRQLKTKKDRLNVICGYCMKHFIKLEDPEESDGEMIGEEVGN